MKKLIPFTCFCFISISASAQPFQELLKMVNSDRDTSDHFGYDVDSYDDYAIVGAYGNDFSTDENAGAAYIYERTGINNWVEMQILTNSDQDGYDRFGYAVAIYGDLAVVGAYGEDEDETGSNTLSRAGSVYIFERNAGGAWNEVQKIVASDRDADDEFGWAVDIYDSTIIVGAHQEQEDEFGLNTIHHAGSVYIFDRNAGGIWVETQKIVASERAPDIVYPGGYSGEDLSDQFGGTVAIWNNWLVVGAHHHDYGPGLTAPMWSSGAAYIFERSAGVWNEVEKIQNFDRDAWDRFGYDVAIDTNIIIVSSYSEDELEDGISGFVTNAGSAHIFERNPGGAWNQVQKIVPLDRDAGDHFGYSLDIQDTFIVVGTHSDNHDEFDSDYLLDAGSAYIFKQNGAGIWAQYQKLDASDRDSLDEHGVSCTIWGTTVMVGAYNQAFDAVGTDSTYLAGAVYEYNTDDCEPNSLDQVLTMCSGSTVTVGTSTYSTTGTYIDILTNAGGCDSVVTTDLTITPPVTSSQDEEICFGAVFLIGTSSYSVSGTYEDTLTAFDGCDSVVTTNLTVLPEIAVEQDVSICWGGSYTIGASTYSVAGTYVDVLTSSDFCDSTVTTNLTVELPLDLSVSQVDNYLTANQAGATYQWYDCDNDVIVSGAIGQSWWAFGIGNFACIITMNGCVDTTACVNVSTFGFDENSSDGIMVYPNPNGGKFNVSFSGGSTTIDLFDSYGKHIFSQQITSGTTEIDPGNLAPGVYYLRFSGEVTEVRRVVVR